MECSHPPGVCVYVHARTCIHVCVHMRACVHACACVCACLVSAMLVSKLKSPGFLNIRSCLLFVTVHIYYTVTFHVDFSCNSLPFMRSVTGEQVV